VLRGGIMGRPQQLQINCISWVLSGRISKPTFGFIHFFWRKVEL
jgi:hypothetical protein